MSDSARGIALLGRNLTGLARAPLALRAVNRRFGPGTARLKGLRQTAFYPQLGLAFNRVKKNANTALILLLHELETGESGAAGRAKDAAPNLFDLPRRELARLEDYAFFTTIRDPYSRVLSAFLDKFRREGYQRRHGAFPLTPEGFGAFLDWLAAGGLAKDAHWDLQGKLLALPLDRYDAVLRFEHLREDATTFLTGRGFTLPEGALASEHKGDRGKETGADRQRADFYTPERAALVARLYAEDFAALGYPTEWGG